MSRSKDPAVLVAGTGPVGLAAALALSKQNCKVVLAGPPPSSKDRRTTALMRPAVRFLEELGLAGDLEEHSAPLVTMRIADLTQRLFRSPTVTFHAAEIGEEYFGLNIPNTALTAAMADAVRESQNITWHEALVENWSLAHNSVEARLTDGTSLEAKLAVAADGRNSPARAAAGVSVLSRRLPQSALVLNFAHARHHGFTSTEFHTENGPCTQVPLQDGFRSSLVWVLHPDEVDSISSLQDMALSDRVEQRLQSFLGKVNIEPGWQVYPLSSVMPRRFSARRIALIGEAAHVFPPITAQGLNLGLRDVKELSLVVEAHPDDPGSIAALETYDSKRRPDILARSSAVNLLNASLLSSLLPAQLARSAGFGILDSAPALRGFFMREGMRPGSGFGALFPSFGRDT